jgi:ribonuclease HI
LAELEALEAGLNLCLEVGITKVVIEGDSQIILNAIRKRSTPNWVINSRLDYVLNLLDRFEDYHICHIYREGNSIADQLANYGADGINFHLIKGH